MSILTPMAQDLLQETVCYPLTIIYIPLKWCGYAYKIFESILGINQYHPKGSMPTPENRLFAQFHSPQIKEMKDVILKQLCSSKSTVRVLFATVALGMGVLCISPHHILSKRISRRQVELGGMDNLQLLCCTIIIGMWQRTNVGCKKLSDIFAKVMVNALDTSY